MAGIGRHAATFLTRQRVGCTLWRFRYMYRMYLLEGAVAYLELPEYIAFIVVTCDRWVQGKAEADDSSNDLERLLKGALREKRKVCPNDAVAATYYLVTR